MTPPPSGRTGSKHTTMCRGSSLEGRLEAQGRWGCCPSRGRGSRVPRRGWGLVGSEQGGMGAQGPRRRWEDRQGCSPRPHLPQRALASFSSVSPCCHPAAPGSPSVPVLQAVCGGACTPVRAPSLAGQRGGSKHGCKGHPGLHFAEKHVSGELGQLRAGELGAFLSTLTRPREALHGVAHTPWRPGEAWWPVSLSASMHVDQVCGSWLTCACGGTGALS